MIEADCRSCVFYNTCEYRRFCRHYSPIGDEAEDEYIKEYTEKSRREFDEVWRIYANEYNA